MRAKIIGAFLLGVAFGVAALFLALRLMVAMGTDNFPRHWSKEGKSDEDYKSMLHACTRALLLGEAFTIAKNGRTQEEVRSLLGSPDIVVSGEDYERFRLRRRDAASAYIYKIGRCGITKPYSFRVLTISFDEVPRIVSVEEWGLNDGDPWASAD
ncbi:hypothetical protein [Hyphomicrobium sp. 2TAF46]|uniref:hypothetical protein n=1 Tax=Hyphomicrobium sp. 2TAF46 TaxID=3233019 RepID=UPI003F8F6D11